MISLSQLNKLKYFLGFLIVATSTLSLAEEEPIDIWKSNENATVVTNGIDLRIGVRVWLAKNKFFIIDSSFCWNDWASFMRQPFF